MRTSETIGEITKALITAHSEMKEVERNSVNPFTKSEYADLEAVLAVVRPILAENKLALMQSPTYRDGVVYVTSRLLHESGEWMEDDASAGALPADPQKAGAAITYLRRYAAMAICGIAPKDDDANPGPNKKKKGQRTEGAQTEKSMEAVVKAFPADVKALFKAAKVWNWTDQYRAYKQVEGDMDALKQLLNEKIKGAK